VRSGTAKPWLEAYPAIIAMPSIRAHDHYAQKPVHRQRDVGSVIDLVALQGEKRSKKVAAALNMAAEQGEQ
jgi:hypothetical protein